MSWHGEGYFASRRFRNYGRISAALDCILDCAPLHKNLLDLMATLKPVPVIDLFAGPGGLGEGFSSIYDAHGERSFVLKVSIEKDPVAHKTLSLRALFRSFRRDTVPDCYYDYVKGHISRDQLFNHPSVPEQARLAAKEAKCAELGKTPQQEIDGWIASALCDAKEWVLIGGPPCQAYSLAGRSRRAREETAEFEKDEKHFLYKEYLRIIRKFSPSVFVMENVKGILSSQHSGSHIFDRILSDLSRPGGDLEYQIRSFVVPSEVQNLDPRDYVIEAERFGVPQSRHRVILFGIRSDLADTTEALRTASQKFVISNAPSEVSVKVALSGLPRLRSRLSKEPDSHGEWLAAIRSAIDEGLKWWRGEIRENIEYAIAEALISAKRHSSVGERFIPCNVITNQSMPQSLRSWFHDPRLKGVLQHETRSHMRSDLARYVYAACYAKEYKYSPKLENYPERLLPKHGNVGEETIPFADRFRVQLSDRPSATVVAHIAKDGHYYIHYDPAQCRSLTVREAARLQTFPDNYFFEGNRTEQYTQIGNAVPPWLAKQIAEVVMRFLTASRR